MPTTTTTATVTVFLLLLLFLSGTGIPLSSAAPIPGLDSFLTQQSRIDPKSTKDPFPSLPSSLKKSLSSSSPGHLHIPSLISSLLSLSVPIPLHVRLVGPDFTSSSLLTSFLQSSVTSSHFHLISTPSPSQHSLSVTHSLHLDVSSSPSSLSSSLSAAISSALSASPSSLRSPLLSISYTTVDSIISRHFDSEKSDNSVYIYILNLGVKSKQPYAYSYYHADSSAGYTNCLGTLWTGNKRYLWIDLGAGPVDYGPALSGDGVLPRGEFHPLAALHGGPKSDKALLSEFASLIYSAYQVLVVPPLRIPVHFESSLIVQLIHIHASGSEDLTGLDWNMIEKSFRNEANDGGGLLFGNQSLEFKKYSIKYEECSICSFAISRSTNSFTSRFLFDNYTLIVSEYLDSKRLHQILSDSAEEFRRVAGLQEEEFGSRVLPVYVFDLDIHTILLLDRYHQTIAFRDMVIAVRTKTAQTVSDYSCNGRHVFTRTRELQRPLVGAILQSMWGVSPTHLIWSPTHKSTLVDYTWSVGQTPFGPFSEVSSLSFVQKDAARRNFILTSLNYSVTSAIDVLESVDAHGGDRNLLKQKQYVEFIQRWHLFRYKLDKTVSALSHYDFEMAFYYLKSSDHDLYAIHDLVYTASQEIEASLVCFKDPPFPWAALSFSAAGFLALSYVYAKRDRLFRNKRKQF